MIDIELFKKRKIGVLRDIFRTPIELKGIKMDNIEKFGGFNSSHYIINLTQCIY